MSTADEGGVKEPAGRVRRHRGWPAVGLAVVLAGIAGAVVVLTGRHPATTAKPRTCETPVAGRAGGRQPVSPPTGGGLRVTEKGFTGLSGGWVALGAMLENTSSLVAYRTRVDFHVLDGRHRSALDQTSPVPRTTVLTVLPGQRVGVGSKALVRQKPGFSAGTATSVAELDVSVRTAQWWPAGGPLRPVTAPYRQTRHVSSDAADYLYTVDSPLCTTVAREGLSIIFRNRAGAVAGGLFVQGDGHASCAPGTRDEDVLVGGVPQGIDEHRTEIYPYCDLVAPPRS